MEKTQKSKVAKWSLIIGIVILSNLFINVSLDLIYQSPDYNDYCPRDTLFLKTEPTEVEIIKQQNEYDECMEKYDTQRESYEKKVFVTLISIGVVIFVISLFNGLNYVVATSLSLASVLNFIIASMRYWSSADALIKIVILGLALAVLIWIGIKKFSE
jgi:lysylphosphatidylglycerol synthetase-like protein (DUF2156 family)